MIDLVRVNNAILDVQAGYQFPQSFLESFLQGGSSYARPVCLRTHGFGAKGIPMCWVVDS